MLRGPQTGKAAYLGECLEAALAPEDFVQATEGVRGFAYPHADLPVQGAILGNSAAQVLQVVHDLHRTV